MWQTTKKHFGQIWTKLSVGHRLILVLLVLMSLSALVGVTLWAGRADYQVLFTGLNAEECGTLVSSLKEAGIDVRVAEGGSALMVPSRSVNSARMIAAEEGLPKTGGGGFDAFREPKIGMTPFAERVNYLSALQAELATTIISLDAVVYARVHLALPERTIFKDDAAKPTASVMVVPRGNCSLTRAQVNGITNLVASAVEGLNAEDVTVSDGKGNVLTGGGKGAPEATAGDQWSYRQKVERDLSDKAESMLTRVLGPGCCEVRVSADLDFTNQRETSRQYDPTKRVVVRERIESCSSSGSGTTVGGAAGTGAQFDRSAGGAGGSSSGESKSENIDTEYLVSESVRETVHKGADIKRLTVAAFIQIPTAEQLEAASAEVGAKVPQMEEISKVIKDAVGLDETRGDSLKIVEATFHPETSMLLAVQEGGMPRWLLMAAQYGSMAALALVLLVIARSILKSIESIGPRRVLTPEIVAADGDIAAASEATKDQMIRQQVNKYVQENPESVTRLLEGWLEGEE